MGRLGKFWASSVGKKVVMGATGIILVGFLIVHMAGNLQLFLGAERFNAYSKLLKHDIIELTWIVRLTLLVSVILHAVSAYQLTMRNRAARPEAYAKRVPQVSTYASQTMRFGGVYLLFFIVYHLGHFTTGTFHPAFSETGAYSNVMIGFETWSTALFYLGAMAFLSLHLYHGVWAAFRTLGLARPSGDPLKRQIALVLAIVVAGGFSLVPLAVKLGLVH
jgi:succinate dehydrogenase / fumarate reductase cytochrome b subunit